MARMAVMTKSFAPDFELCAALNRSVLDNTRDAIHHHIIVPRSDLKIFDQLAGPRTHIRSEADLLPRTFVPMPFSNFVLNLARPFPPVRGWILQQVIKLAALAASEDDAVLVVDSDAEFIRPFTAEMFVRDGKVRFFCKPNQIDRRLPRHMTWHRVARVLLGLPPGGTTVPGLHLLASCLGSDDRQADVGTGRGHYGTPLEDCNCRAARLLRVRALWRFRRCCDRRVGQRVRFGRLALRGLLGGYSAKFGWRGPLHRPRPADRRSCCDPVEVSDPAVGSRGGLFRPSVRA
jgi:hypothetical protein